jgi:hypothetical protein
MFNLGPREWAPVTSFHRLDIYNFFKDGWIGCNRGMIRGNEGGNYRHYSSIWAMGNKIGDSRVFVEDGCIC